MTPTFVNKKREGNRLKRYFYYRCIKTLKHEWDSCPTKQVNADKLERLITKRLDAISNDDFYLNALVRTHRGEENNTPHRTGFELRESENQISVKSDEFCHLFRN